MKNVKVIFFKKLLNASPQTIMNCVIWKPPGSYRGVVISKFPSTRQTNIFMIFKLETHFWLFGYQTWIQLGFKPRTTRVGRGEGYLTRQRRNTLGDCTWWQESIYVKHCRQRKWLGTNGVNRLVLFNWVKLFFIDKIVLQWCILNSHYIIHANDNCNKIHIFILKLIIPAWIFVDLYLMCCFKKTKTVYV